MKHELEENLRIHELSIIALERIINCISGPYGMRYTNNFVGTIHKSNMRSLNVSLSNWNKLPNHVKLLSSYTSHNVFIKVMVLDSYA